MKSRTPRAQAMNHLPNDKSCCLGYPVNNTLMRLANRKRCWVGATAFRSLLLPVAIVASALLLDRLTDLLTFNSSPADPRNGDIFASLVVLCSFSPPSSPSHSTSATGRYTFFWYQSQDELKDCEGSMSRTGGKSFTASMTRSDFYTP